MNLGAKGRKAIIIISAVIAVLSIILFIGSGDGVFLVVCLISTIVCTVLFTRKPKEDGYQIFISYRRSGDSYLPGRVADRLRLKGYRVFLDVESLNSGTFNEQICNAVCESTDFLLVLENGSLERCADENDYVRREIELAQKKGKNIIPLLTKDFVFPENLSDDVPEDIKKVCDREGITISAEYFDAFMDKIEVFLHCNKTSKNKKYQKNKVK